MPFVATTTAVVALNPTTNFHDNPSCLHNGYICSIMYYDEYDNNGGDVCCVEKNVINQLSWFFFENTCVVIHFHITTLILRLFTNISTFFLKHFTLQQLIHIIDADNDNDRTRKRL